jgi:hypothetical protein
MKRSELEIIIAETLLKNKNCKSVVDLAEILVSKLDEIEVGPYRTHHGIRHAMHFEKEDKDERYN